MKSINLPNALALSRVLAAPLMYMFLVNRDLFPNIHPTWLDYFAAFLFVLASITDFFDGYIAREFDQVTQLGKILDPLADKMLTLAGFLGLMMLGRADPWAIYLILTREFFITGLRVSAVGMGKEISASFLGKIKTIVQMIAIGFLIMNWPGGTLLLWLAVIITLYSGFEYIKEYMSVKD
ncbi:CDP-diacylglycerol--glycerol-3-phosphate 3-phosphatidyltransferase [Nitratiruptor sp. YY09-18]|uniref:CDP-diacylglycerol--glycerol-3-phosphate 3-phosphatidyltransferase n=1 Tax=Nitratiruptor sp. YY09-18 TaxID=2724901 RepID=UPI00193750C6|nr:CDP-diacylglycerol--glycerol-3-phosphate 3-phosphatidyltransferase [Nitratiruptor sp. YY09-18]BCD68310.1 CDP-diacylglycerol---glycerol-3-phosphate 3-phosphatidyltransferase [Nitratiruptor sp. YY09-18]